MGSSESCDHLGELSAVLLVGWFAMIAKKFLVEVWTAERTLFWYSQGAVLDEGPGRYVTLSIQVRQSVCKNKKCFFQKKFPNNQNKLVGEGSARYQDN